MSKTLVSGSASTCEPSLTSSRGYDRAAQPEPAECRRAAADGAAISVAIAAKQARAQLDVSANLKEKLAR
jgi:hypothetical protein